MHFTRVTLHNFSKGIEILLYPNDEPTMSINIYVQSQISHSLLLIILEWVGPWFCVGDIISSYYPRNCLNINSLIIYAQTEVNFDSFFSSFKLLQFMRNNKTQNLSTIRYIIIRIVLIGSKWYLEFGPSIWLTPNKFYGGFF